MACCEKAFISKSIVCLQRYQKKHSGAMPTCRAGIEVSKLGHGGIDYVSDLLDFVLMDATWINTLTIRSGGQNSLVIK